VHILNVLLELRYHILNPKERNWITVLIHSTWFYGAPIGFILSAVDTQKLRKRNIYVYDALNVTCKLQLIFNFFIFVSSDIVILIVGYKQHIAYNKQYKIR
jgi:hypothetical protein